MSQADVPLPTPEDDVIPKQERVEYVVDQKLIEKGLDVGLPALTGDDDDAGKPVVVRSNGDRFELGPLPTAFMNAGWYIDNGPFAEDPLPLIAGKHVTSTRLIPVVAGAGHGVAPYCFINGYVGGEPLMGCIFSLSNLAGTQRITLTKTSITRGQSGSPNLSGWTVSDQVGSDLHLASGNDTVESTAGGVFLVTTVWSLVSVS